MRMEHSENFKAVLEEKTREAESIIAAYLPKEEGFAKELAKAMNYSMTAGGKRLRPLLLQESFRLFGGTGEAVKPFMAAMEMIHTHSTGGAHRPRSACFWHSLSENRNFRHVGRSEC